MSGETREKLGTLEAERQLLAKDRILAFYSRFAYATVPGARLEWDQNLSAGGTVIAMHVELDTGVRYTELIDLSPLITEWAKQSLAERGVGI